LRVTNTINFLSLGIFTATLAIGQVLFKHIGLAIRGMSVMHAAATVFRQPEFYVALAIYGAATLLWIWILGRVSLMQAYPWAGACVIFVPLMGSYVFGEKAGPLFWVGAGLIALGIVLTQYSGHST
jgi:multidrug transporter EmrE-like cation transporter